LLQPQNDSESVVDAWEARRWPNHGLKEITAPLSDSGIGSPPRTTPLVALFLGITNLYRERRRGASEIEVQLEVGVASGASSINCKRTITALLECGDLSDLSPLWPGRQNESRDKSPDTAVRTECLSRVRVCGKLFVFGESRKVGTVGTTKLTRKEILGDDPVHDVMVSAIEGVRHRGKHVAFGAAVILLLGSGIYLALEYLEKRDMESQQILSRGIDFYHAQVDSAAPDDPYGKGPDPVFRTEEAKYQAASKEFSSVISRFGSSRVAVIARYYLGLCQVRFGQRKRR